MKTSGAFAFVQPSLILGEARVPPEDPTTRLFWGISQEILYGTAYGILRDIGIHPNETFQGLSNPSNLERSEMHLLD